jgi:hypothetical protein
VAFFLPFCFAGIALAGIVAMWITGASPGHGNVWFLILFPCLVVIGAWLGTLIAYTIMVCFGSWVSPSHPLVAYNELPGNTGRLLNPAFRRAHAFASRLAPRRQ